MIQQLPLFIAIRYIRSRHHNRFLSFISMTSLSGLILGVMALIIVLSVVNGLNREIRDRALVLLPHAAVHGKQGIENWQVLLQQILDYEEVQSASPYIDSQVLLIANGRHVSAAMKGVLPAYETMVSPLDEHMQEGQLVNLKEGKFHIILGYLLARNLGVGYGDSVSVFIPRYINNSLTATTQMFRVSGIFRVGPQEDSRTAFIHLQDAVRLMDYKNMVSSIRLRIKDIFVAPQLTEKISKHLPTDLFMEDWSNSSLFKATKLEKKMLTFLLLMVVFIASFTIVSTLVVMVGDKQAEIAILRTMGARAKTILHIFMFQGVIIGISGIILGVLLGCGISLYLEELVIWLQNIFGFRIFPDDIYTIDTLPSELRGFDVLIVAVCSLLISFLATVYPAYQASKLEPAKALRYEI